MPTISKTPKEYAVKFHGVWPVGGEDTMDVFELRSEVEILLDGEY